MVGEWLSSTGFSPHFGLGSVKRDPWEAFLYIFHWYYIYFSLYWYYNDYCGSLRIKLWCTVVSCHSCTQLLDSHLFKWTPLIWIDPTTGGTVARYHPLHCRLTRFITLPFIFTIKLLLRLIYFILINSCYFHWIIL